jgi:uncharacterized protein
MAKQTWRRWNNILHRDIGYLAVGLTLVYALSGLAVNHTADWNPSYVREARVVEIGPVRADSREALIAEVKRKLRLDGEEQNAFRPDPETLQLFYDGVTYSVDLPTGTVIVEETRHRPVLFEVNQLHLNAPKRLWTWIADLYALALIVVAITGLFVLRGRLGITGRGAWLTAMGVVLPAVYWVYYLYIE